MKRPLVTALLIAIMASSLLFVSSAHFAMAQSGTNVSGIITSDTTWSLANSPYNFTGNVTVATGVTLTVEPGADVNVSRYFLQVEGTLIASGTSTNKINFDSFIYTPNPQELYPGGIVFMQSSTGSLIENAYVTGIDVINSSPKIDQNIFSGVDVEGGSPIICNNKVWDSIGVDGGSPTISNNTFPNSYSLFPSACGIFLSGTNTAIVSDNDLTNSFADAAILITSGAPIIERNVITDIPYGNNHSVGITIYGTADPVIENNTITENSIGLNIYDENGSPTATIAYNNFEGNTQYNIYLGVQNEFTYAASLDASYNWWGTIDVPTINQTIYDFKNNYNLGTVTFTPILTAPNTEATPNPNAPIATSNPAQTANPTVQPTAQPGQSSSSPTQPNTQNQTWTLTETELLGVIAVLLAVILGLLAAFIIFWRRTKAPKIEEGT
jgi:parallel beta-helix repeat protein